MTHPKRPGTVTSSSTMALRATFTAEGNEFRYWWRTSWVAVGKEFGTSGERVRHRFRPKRPKFATDSWHSFLQLLRTEVGL